MENKRLNNLQQFVSNARQLARNNNDLAKSYCIDILIEKGATSKENAVSFEDYDDRPCTNSINNPNSDDVASAEVLRIWVKDNYFVYANLYFYYESEENSNVLLENDYEIDWLEILQALLNKNEED